MSTTSVSASTASPIGPLPTDPKARLQKAAHAMEGLWLAQILKEGTPKSGMLGKSFAASTFQDMMNQALAQKMADTGMIGLSDSLTRQLLPGLSAPTKPSAEGDHHGKQE